MASCDTWTYGSVDAAVFKKLQKTALQQGVVIPSQTAGEFRLKVSSFSIAFRFKHELQMRTLRLTCIDKPALVSCGIVKSYADKIVRDCGGKPI